MQGTHDPSDIFTPTPHSSRTESKTKTKRVTKNVKMFPLQESSSLFVKFWFTPTFLSILQRGDKHANVDVYCILWCGRGFRQTLSTQEDTAHL